jgi:hypothetical protein
VYVEDLSPAFPIGQTDLHLKLQSTWAEHGGIEQVPPVGDAHD